MLASILHVHCLSYVSKSLSQLSAQNSQRQHTIASNSDGGVYTLIQ